MDANAQVLFSRAARPSQQTRAWRSSKEDMSWSWMNLPMTTACIAAARATGHVLLRDDLGCFTLRRLRPWHHLLARFAAGRLDSELAAGVDGETSVVLAARAMQLTSMKFRRDLSASLLRILAVVGQLPAAVPSQAGTVRPPHVPLCRARISRSAGPLAALAGSLAAPGLVSVQGAAIVSQLLADGTGPLYQEANGDDLDAIIEKASQALTL